MDANGAASTSNGIDPELFQRIQPAEYLSRFLEHGYRPDGRRPNEFREPILNVGSITSADGSALVKTGQTTILCGIRAEIAEPDLLAPSRGFLVPNVELPAMCSPKFRPGPPSDEAQVLSHRIRSILLSSAILPLSSLCIEPGKAAWVVYADLVCLNYDGNLVDAALVAVVAALQNTRLPKAQWDVDLEEAVAVPDELNSLHLRSTVLCASFGVSEGGHLLCDPTAFEEPLLATHLSIVLDDDGMLRNVYQAGLGVRDTQLPAKLLVQAVAMARKRYKVLREAMQ
ncbi:MAG: hypothetical protein CYPHOPRED_000096 [Cyphobasidiales sp. Tagirdzhanova-0007]|nr:MAG: hypothetical protein CYPHOPRED_000096 [Cyphobasidiales sp. Tagirdzhanova-0007]